MDSFNSLFDEVFGPTRLLDSVPRVHHSRCTCLSCHFAQVLAPPTSDFLLTLEMPGTKKQDVSVTLKGDLVRIEYTTRYGESKAHTTSIGSKYFDVSKLDCKYEDGLLTIKAPLKKIKPETPPEPPETKIEIK